MILIVTINGDLHALTVQDALRRIGHGDCLIIECDRIAQCDALSFGINYDMNDRVITSGGQLVSIGDASVLWLRTVSGHQILDRPVDDEHARAIIENDARGGLLGYLSTHFRGRWISTPDATVRASDKIVQLQAALRCGFRVPKTLISQSRDDVKDFFEFCSRQVILKTIVGAPGPMLETRKLRNPDEFDDDSFQAAPAIFQEYIPGSRHLRLVSFGDEAYAALIQTDDLDWRGNLNVPVSTYEVDDDLRCRVRDVLETLGLEMGIIDLKLTPDDEPVWLEVNPQGQFLFLDALTDLRLTERFAAYLFAQDRALVG